MRGCIYLNKVVDRYKGLSKVRGSKHKSWRKHSNNKQYPIYLVLRNSIDCGVGDAKN